MCGFDSVTHRLVIEREAQPPLDFSLETLDDGQNLASLAIDVLQCARIRREEREQLHRQHRPRRQKVLHDRLMRHRPAADPIQVLQPVRERGVASYSFAGTSATINQRPSPAATARVPRAPGTPAFVSSEGMAGRRGLRTRQ